MSTSACSMHMLWICRAAHETCMYVFYVVPWVLCRAKLMCAVHAMHAVHDSRPGSHALGRVLHATALNAP